jgi:hypothetical protein
MGQKGKRQNKFGNKAKVYLKINSNIIEIDGHNRCVFVKA